MFPTRKRHLLAGLLVAAGTLFSYPAAANMADARQAINEGRYAQALGILDRHLKANPQDAEARFSRGLVLVRMQRTDEAIQVFADLTRDFPQLPEPYNNLAVLYAQRGDYERARDELEAALSTHPSYSTAHENLGDVYTALATAAYNRALVLDRDNDAIRVKLNLLNQMEGTTPTTEVAAAEVPSAVEQTAAPTPAPTPVTTPTPVQTPEPAPVAAADNAISDGVTRTLFGWASAWSNQNVDGYLDAYHPEFDPEDGSTRAQWARVRRARVSAPDSIKVRLVEPSVEVVSAEEASVTFIQIYESDSYSDRVRKRLIMRPANGEWKIYREAVVAEL